MGGEAPAEPWISSHTHAHPRLGMSLALPSLPKLLVIQDRLLEFHSIFFRDHIRGPLRARALPFCQPLLAEQFMAPIVRSGRRDGDRRLLLLPDAAPASDVKSKV